MIIFPAAFVLTATVPLRFPRLAWQTWLRDLAPAAVSVSTESTTGPRDAPLRPDTAEYWEPTALPAHWRVDLGAMRDVDYVAIAAHNLGTLGLTAEVRLGANSDYVSNAVFSSAVLPADNAPILWLGSLTSARYLQIAITGAGSVMPRLAVAYAGVALAIPYDVDGAGFVPLTLSRNTTLMRSLSQGGQFLGQSIRRQGVSAAASFRHLDPAWYREYFDPFVRHARRFPYFFAWWPSQYPRELGYVWSEKDISPDYMGVREWMKVQIPMRGIGNGD